MATAVVMMLGCDRPMPSSVESPVQYSAHVADVSCGGSSLGGSPPRTVQVNVKLSTGAPGAGVVVVALDPAAGPACWGAAGSDGVIRFNGMRRGAQFLLTLRDEASEAVPTFEVIPPAPGAAALLADEPSLPGNRQVPALVHGSACTTTKPLTWSNWDQQRGSPCVVAASGMNVTITLGGNAPVVAVEVLDASNNPLAGIPIVVLSPANVTSSNLPAECAKLPWVNQAECSDPSKSNGPALVQSAGLTKTDGSIELGYAPQTDPLVIEAIAEQDGQTFFGTLIGGGTQRLQLAPGMCMATTIVDGVEPSGFAELDIRTASHSVGMVAVAAGPQAPPVLTPVAGTLIVKSVIHATATGGTGQFTLTYKLDTGGNRSVRIPFSIATSCAVGGGSGNGVGGSTGVSTIGYCAPTAAADPVEPGRTSYTLFFVVTGLPGDRLTSAEYTIKTDRDNLDPSRSDPGYSRGAITFTGLNPSSCPVQLNNDGRWLTS